MCVWEVWEGGNGAGRGGGGAVLDGECNEPILNTKREQNPILQTNCK